MFEMPQLLPYPKLIPVNECPEVNNVFCYIIEAYNPGTTILIKRENGEAGIAIGDWAGTKCNGTSESNQVLSDNIPKLLNLMTSVGLNQIEAYFSSDDVLVDVQVSLNKFIGPGMLRDLFSKVFSVQKISAVEIINDEKLVELRSSNKHYVLKPSRFRCVQREDLMVPLYACI